MCVCGFLFVRNGQDASNNHQQQQQSGCMFVLTASGDVFDHTHAVHAVPKGHTLSHQPTHIVTHHSCINKS